MASSPDTDAPDYLTPKEVARLFDVTSATIWDWARTGKIPAFKLPSGQFRFIRSEIEPFLPPDPKAAAS